jgi:integrase/recombinase XerD
MKSLALKNPSFRYLEQSFKEWLDVLGYAPISVYNMPLQVRELLHYLESENINHIKELDIKHIKGHYSKLKERGNARRGGGLSNNHLNKHIQALRKFADYLRQVGRLTLPELQIKNEEADAKSIAVLTEEEIQLLFKATEKTPEGRPHYNLSAAQVEAMQSRDRAMLAIFYGCGLRRNEGVNTDVGDINFDRAMLHVRKGKNYKERFVPISKTSLKYLQEYIYDHRPEILLGSKTEALFISMMARRMDGQTMLVRLKHLQHQTENADLIEKEIGLHTLRHSIATHLLQAGMELESIARFLGHSTLESTQIYTHLAGVEEKKEQPFTNIRKYARIQLSEDEKDVDPA